jgi:hypothetical protein
MKLQASITMSSSKKWDPSATRGPSISAAKWRGVVTILVAGGATSCGPRSSAAGGGGPGQPPPLGAPDRCSPRGGEPASPPPPATACSEHFPVRDPEGSKRWRSLGWHGSPCCAVALQCAGNLRRPPGGDLRFVLAARRAPAVLSPRARGSGGGGGGRGIHRSGKCQRKE